MAIPSAASLKNRARLLLEAMGEQERWVYAVPTEAAEVLRQVALALAFQEPSPGVFEGPEGARLQFLEDPEIETGLLVASGAGVVPVLGKVLEQAGFFAQSRLLEVAYDPEDEEAPAALRTLAYMISSWTDPWPELFELHLASPTPGVRASAVRALGLLARGTPRDAVQRVLEAQASREGDPGVQAAVREALGALGG
jgi:hypothetical protein